MAYEEQVLKTLEEIKQALKHIYGEGEEQDSLIHEIEKNIRLTMQSENAKLQRELENLTYKFNTMVPRLTDALNNLTKKLEKLDLEDMKEDINIIRVQLGNMESKLRSIDSKVSR